ncbi:MAG: (2Fe-2S)-binding protein [Desulfobulbales bacterium]
MEAEDIKKEWLRQNEIICICRGIPRKRFIEAIRQGGASVAEINRMVGSGWGDCKGERCGPKIAALLALYSPEK